MAEAMAGVIASAPQCPRLNGVECTQSRQLRKADSVMATPGGTANAPRWLDLRGERSQCRKLRNGVLRISGRRTSVAAAAAGADREDVDAAAAAPRRRRKLRPVVERFNIHHEKNVSEERLKELGVRRWSKWECGPCVTTFWKWDADELVYIAKGSVEMVPDGCDDGAFFYAGDLVRFPKWLEASLTFDEDYEQYYKFLAYGD